MQLSTVAATFSRNVHRLLRYPGIGRVIYREREKLEEDGHVPDDAQTSSYSFPITNTCRIYLTPTLSPQSQARRTCADRVGVYAWAS